MSKHWARFSYGMGVALLTASFIEPGVQFLISGIAGALLMIGAHGWGEE